jgi:catechol 2,3-dioxygenase-like lactoylglutathione lyase family enzyme
VLDQVNLVVPDMVAAVDFYRRLGVEIGDMPPPWDVHHREAPGPKVSLELDSVSSSTYWGDARPRIVLGFRAPTREDVDRLYGEITAAGAPGVTAPYDAFWGSRYATVEDPDGNAVGIMSPPDDAYRSAPPDPGA